MKIWLGLLLALFSFSASASYDKDLDLPSGQINEQSSPRMLGVVLILRGCSGYTQ